MEFSGMQKALLAIPSRWPPILLGIILSLFISAICTSNIAMRVIPTSESSSSTLSSPWAPSPSSTVSTISSQLFFFLFRRPHTKAAAPYQGNPDLGEAGAILPSSMSEAKRSSPSGETAAEPDSAKNNETLTTTQIPHFNKSMSESKHSSPSAEMAAEPDRIESNTTLTTEDMHHFNESEGSGSSNGGNVFTNASSTTLSKVVISHQNNSGGSSPTASKPLQDEHEGKPPNSTESVRDRFSYPLLNVNDPQTLLDDKAVLHVDDKPLSASQQSIHSDTRQCDISIGSWVEDSSYPLYSPSTCPYVDESFNCQHNGRPDSKYNKWRWAPRDCNVPRFNGTHFMEVLRGKRLVFVGDSLNRNQWESMLCMLRDSLSDKKRLVQINGGRISKLPGAYVFKFLDYDFKVEFYTSPYLVDKEDGLNSTDFRVRLDRMDISERRWRKADVLLFNTGHWWTPDKIGNGENRFQEGLEVHKILSVPVAYRKALTTWGKWVDTNVDPKNSIVFFRGYSPIHYFGGQWNSGGQCQDETDPIFNETFIAPYPAKMRVLDEVLQQMKVPVQVLNITRLSDFRKDGHPALYGHALQYEGQYQDCSHWCLPGLPDIWNELLYFALLNNQPGYGPP